MNIAAATQTRYATLSGFAQTIPGRIILALCATLVVAAASHIALPLPFTPVPLTMQPLGVLGVGLVLGPVTGFFAMLAYLLEGALGLPVFSPTGPGGLLQLFGPTGGFLMAYPLVAAIAGGVVRPLLRLLPRFVAALIACIAATNVLFLCGAGWLMYLGHLSLRQTLVVAVLAFVPGEAIKIMVVSGIYSTLGSAKRVQ